MRRFGAIATASTWNAHWVGTHAPIDGVLRNGLGGAINTSFNAQICLRATPTIDYFSPSFRNSDLGFFFGRPNKNEINVTSNLCSRTRMGFCGRVREHSMPGQGWTNDEGLNLRSGLASSRTSSQSRSGEPISASSGICLRSTISIRAEDRRSCKPANTFFNTGDQQRFAKAIWLWHARDRRSR